jgi:CHRD domain
VVVLTAAPVAQATDTKPTVLSTVMTGAAEVPGPGDPDGRGFFAAVVKGDKLCYVIAADKIATATAAHIHVGAVGVAGPVVVPLQPPNRLAADCVRPAPALLADIVANPSDYYVNVHNAEFPAGAIRGQLH